MTLRPAYRRKTKTDMLHACLELTWPEWCSLDSTEVTAFFGALQSFIRANYNDEGISVPVEVTEVWKRSKERICARYLYDEAQEEPK